LNVLDQARVRGIDCRILSVGSSEEYGNIDTEKLPLREDMPLNPVSPYAVARASQEMLSKVYVDGYGLDVVMTRSFNHTGPFQRDAFVVPSLARQLVAIARGAAPPRLVTGDLSVVRDFVDVRDVVRAYHALLLHGQAGEVYNVCRGEGHSIAEVLATMQEILATNVTLEIDPQLVRPSDNRVVIGSREKIGRAVNWAPKVSLRESLEETIRYWQQS
jgi:GDP-4-dehydro-6-deoxy-D-mannose reductase